MSDKIVKYFEKKIIGNFNTEESLAGLSQLSFESESESYCPYCPEDLRSYISKNLRYLDNVVECFKVPLKTRKSP